MLHNEHTYLVFFPRSLGRMTGFGATATGLDGRLAGTKRRKKKKKRGHEQRTT